MPCTAEPGNPTPRGGRGKEIARQGLSLLRGGNGNPADHAAEALQDVSTPVPTQAERSPAHGHEAPVEAIPRKVTPPEKIIPEKITKEETGAGHHRIDVDPGRWPGIGTPDTANQRRHPTTETRR